MKRVTGIWIDKRCAKIVILDGGSEELHTIHSSIEEYRPKGGSGTKVKGGPQDVIQDSKFAHREKQQEKAFFKNVIDFISTSGKVVIFGPAQTGKKLYSEMSESYPDVYRKVQEVKTADSMTNNQIKAWVRDYFAK